MLTKQVFIALGLVIVAGVSAGCAPAMMAPTVVEGRVFPVEETTELRPGMLPAEVETLLGTPLERADSAPVVWRYDFTRRLRVCVMLMGPIPLEPIPTERHVLSLVFGNGGLEQAVYVQVLSGRKIERTLVGASGADDSSDDEPRMTHRQPPAPPGFPHA